MLRLLNFEKKYGDTLIIAVDSLAFSPGVHWIRGVNGSGKSTLFKALAGLIPCKGSIGFDDGVSLHGHPGEYRRRVNFSEAEPLYPSFLTGNEVFSFAARAKAVPPSQQAQIIERFSIGGYLKQPCGTYSSGMTKRLSLAISFLGTPDVVILDEPLITLDTSIRDTLTSLIRDSLPAGKTIFLISSHEDLTGYFSVVDTLIVADQTVKPA